MKTECPFCGEEHEVESKSFVNLIVCPRMPDDSVIMTSSLSIGYIGNRAEALAREKKLVTIKVCQSLVGKEEG